MAAMAHDFKVLLKCHFIDFESEEHHIMYVTKFFSLEHFLNGTISCFPHHLHISVVTMLKKCMNETALQNTMSNFEPEHAEPISHDTQSLNNALCRDPVAIARSIINIVRTSQQRCKEFKEVIEYGNRWSQWEDKDGQKSNIPTLTLLHDSPLRWGSTYLMLDHFLYLQAVSIISL